MNAAEMQEAFATQVHSLTGRPPLHSQDIFHWLNQAQEGYVRDRAELFEGTQHIADDLRPLLVNNQEICAEFEGDKFFENYSADKADFPTNYLHLISLRARIRYSRLGLEFDSSPVVGEARTPDGEYSVMTVGCRISQQDDIYRLLRDPFNRSRYKDPLAVETPTGVRVYTDDKFVVCKGYIDYLRKPLQMKRTVDSTQNCELPDSVHHHIIRLGVKLYTESLPK